MSEIITRTYTRGYPHPGEIHVHSRDGGQTWEGYRRSEWHGVQSGEYWYGPDALTLAELAKVTRDYQLTACREPRRGPCGRASSVGSAHCGN